MRFQKTSSSDPLASSRTSKSPASRHSCRRRQQALALAVVLPLLVLPTVSTAAVAVPANVDAALAAAPVAAAGGAVGAPAFDGAAGTLVKNDKVKPVDGKDGRPHEGPFVEIDSTRKSGDGADQKSVYIDGKKVPESNDGVMDDKNRVAPKEGTTGTSGGVSEKDKQRKAQEGQTGERVEKFPDSPKEAPPLPHHEEKKIMGDQEVVKDAKDDNDDAAGLEKPSDLPDKPYDNSIPVPGSAKKDHLDVSKPSPDKSKPPPRPSGDGDDDDGALIQPFHSFVLALTMILFSEIGDKTFLVAALMAMKHDRIVVFSAAFSALFTMTLLSAVLGHAVPSLMPKQVSNILASALFLIFGIRMMREGMAMGADEGVAAEMQEVEMELAEKEHMARENGRRRGRPAAVGADALEMGMGGGRPSSRFPASSRSASSSISPSSRGREGNGGVLSTLRSLGSGLGNLASLLLSPAWVQTFVMTFLGEWGDRSQIATLAMAAGQDYWWVTLGAVIGHAFCTGVAVIGGRAIAGRVSMRVVTLGGAVSFLIFGIIYLFEAFYT